jgi:hypothetical protein
VDHQTACRRQRGAAPHELVGLAIGPAHHVPSGLQRRIILGSFHAVFIAAYMAPVVGFPAVAESACAALPAFAGRVVPNASCGVPKVVCGNTHAELVVAHTGVALADVNFADANASLGTIQVLFRLGLALSLQLVRFACSGQRVLADVGHRSPARRQPRPHPAGRSQMPGRRCSTPAASHRQSKAAWGARTRQQYCRRTRGRWNGGAGGRA